MEIEAARNKYLKNAGHQILKCSMCDAELVDIWITKPDNDFTWEVIAKCCYCGDKSFPVIIHGRFHYGGIVEEHYSNYETGEFQETQKTVVSNFITDTDGRIIIETVKAHVL